MQQQSVPTENYVWSALELFERYGDREAIVSGDRRITYRQLRTEIFTMATELHRRGIRSGSAVAILVGTPPEAVVLQFALHLLGGRSVWIASNTPLKFRVSYLRRADVQTFVYDARLYRDLGKEMADAVPEFDVLCFGPGGQGPDLLEAPVADCAPISRDEPVDEPQALFQTGGTTGDPKLVHNGQQYFDTLRVLSDAWVAAGEHQLRHLAVSGYWHVSGQTAAMMTLFTGGLFVPQEGLTVPLVLRTIAEERITSIMVTPPLLYELLDCPELAETDLSSLKMVSCGGSATAPARLIQAIKVFGPVLRPVYGMSEAAFISAYPNIQYDPEHPDRLASCGLPYGDMKVEIRDPETHAKLPVGEVGEVWLTGGLMMRGYWGQPELTRETLVDGWLRTGDLGRLDADGYIYLVDRIKDMVITGPGSSNIYCRPIEDVLAAHPQVRAAAIVGVPDDALGEKAHGFVVPVPGATVTPEELRDYCIAELHVRWSPREVEFVDELPLTQVGKVDKKALRAAYLARHGADPA
ncbi:MAG TPA: AMP-binding protein [Micromonospora sp.]